MKNNKVQFIRKDGSSIDSVTYSRITYFWSDKNYAWKADKVGLIDTNGEVIIPFI